MRTMAASIGTRKKRRNERFVQVDDNLSDLPASKAEAWPAEGGRANHGASSGRWMVGRSPVKVQPTVNGGPVRAGRGQTAGDSIAAAAHEMEAELIQSRALKRSTLSVDNRGLSAN